MEGRFGDIVLTARYFYVIALVHLTKDFDDLIYSVSFLFHVSGRVLARQSLIFNGPVCGGQVRPPEVYQRFEEENDISRGPEGIYMRPPDRPGFGFELVVN